MNGVNVSMLDILVPWAKAEAYLNANCSGLWSHTDMKTESNKAVRQIDLQDPNTGQKCTSYFFLNDHGMVVMKPKKFGHDWYLQNPNEAMAHFMDAMAVECSGTVSYSVDDQAHMVKDGRHVQAEFFVAQKGAINPLDAGSMSGGSDDAGGDTYKYYLPEYLNARPALQAEVNQIGSAGDPIGAYNRIVVEIITERQRKAIPARQLRDLLDQLYMSGLANHPTGLQLYELVIQEDVI